MTDAEAEAAGDAAGQTKSSAHEEFRKTLDQMTAPDTSIEEPWFFDMESTSKVHEEEATVYAKGMNPTSTTMYEGSPKCNCCINCVQEYPDDVNENIEATDEVQQHAIIVRRKKAHKVYSHEPLEIDSINMVDWYGEWFGFIDQTTQIKDFEGSKRITELDMYPLQHCPRLEAVKKRCYQIGRQFEQLAGLHYVAYQDMALRRLQYMNVVDYNNETLLDERVMIDAKSYYREGHEKPRLQSLNRNQDPLTYDQCLICSPFVRGYALKSKQWVSILARNVREIAWNEDAFDCLVLPEGHKNFVMGFARAHMTGKSKIFDDFIDGKGCGMIILLSGPPGVSKTLMAEAVAEKLHKPLYTIWDAVILLDEAVVFLERGNSHVLNRNRLVSIFLCTLEYFEGVLFLTTNRLQDFDSAFESRIDVRLEFPDLNQASRLRVWKNLLGKLKQPVTFTENEYKTLAAAEVNGRRIKNIIKSSAFIAAAEDEEGGEASLKMKHIQTMLQISAPSQETGQVATTTSWIQVSWVLGLWYQWNVRLLAWLLGLVW
ncbi:hypothetical protein PG994_003125 [Apiospora phragmitis]|uniref:AAA+ ATPase domain-containing protein n=1 Tax=Apiospora phragmitis TaxID=2905665 RepID=A0ABR1W751_9PEZI